MFDSLFDKIRVLNYEICGIFLPGLIFFLGLLGIFGLQQVLTIGDLFKVEELTRLMNHDLVNLLREHKWFSGVSITVISYLSGHILKWLSKDGIWSVFPISFIFSKYQANISTFIDKSVRGSHLLGENQLKDKRVRFMHVLTLRGGEPDNKPRSYSPSMEMLLKESGKLLKASCSAELKSSITLEEWKTFYLVGRNYISSHSNASLVTLYQNKYTFHRSLATAFAAFSWITVLSFLFSSISFLIFLFGSMLFTMLSFVFYNSYEYYWSIWGDHVIADSFILLTKEKET